MHIPVSKRKPDTGLARIRCSAGSLNGCGWMQKPLVLGDRLATLVGNLHGHHGWEDHSYFPELSAADSRFDAGLEVLETDHADLDRVLEDFTRQANRVIKLAHLDEAQAREEAARLHQTSEVIEFFLKRHLGDEEDLAVPIILHHRLRG